MQTLPPLKALQAFEATARLHSFSAAAQELNRVPSAISASRGAAASTRPAAVPQPGQAAGSSRRRSGRRASKPPHCAQS